MTKYVRSQPLKELCCLDVEIKRLFLVVLFPIYRKYSNNIVVQWRIMSLSSL